MRKFVKMTQLLGEFGAIETWSSGEKTLRVSVSYKGPSKYTTMVSITGMRLRLLKNINASVVAAFESGEISQVQMEQALDLVFAELNRRLNHA